MQTYTGRQFWPLDPRPEDIFLTDIAHALSMQCRYAGHCRRFYSVAEHSVLLARCVPKQDRLWALLHDAAEAYLTDIPRPLKGDLANYKTLEAAVMEAVIARFRLMPDMPDSVAEADDRIITDERANLTACVAEWSVTPPPLGVTLRNWSPERAEAEFLGAVSDALLERGVA